MFQCARCHCEQQGTWLEALPAMNDKLPRSVVACVLGFADSRPLCQNISTPPLPRRHPPPPMTIPEWPTAGDISLIRPHDQPALLLHTIGTVPDSLGLPSPSPSPSQDGGNTERQSNCGEKQLQGLHKPASKGSYKAKDHPDSIWPEIPMPKMSEEFQPHREFDAAPSQPLVQSPPLPNLTFPRFSTTANTTHP